MTFGGTAADSFTVDNDSQITAIVDNGSSGDVQVTNPAGSSDFSGFIFTTTQLFIFSEQDKNELLASYQIFNFSEQDSNELLASYQIFAFSQQDPGLLN